MLLLGFPLLWALGLSAYALELMSIPMAWILWRRRPIRLPRGFIVWVLFLLVSTAGFLVLGVNPDDTVPGSVLGRSIGFASRQSGYVAATILLLYVGNLTEEELPTRRIVRQLGVLFGVTTIGGVLALLRPDFVFTSPAAYFVPGAQATSNRFFYNLFHPAFAQVQEFSGEALARPAAPWIYTNTWGSQMALLATWFIVGWLLVRSRRSQLVALGFLGVGLVTIVYSLNRGVWLGLLLMLGYLLLALARRGRIVPLLAVCSGIVLVFALVATTPLRGVLENRLDNGKSDTIRSYTTERALELASESPVVGFGTTRSAIGSPASIAVGRSAECPQCGNIPIGINGSSFTLMVASGWLGLVLYWAFWAHQAWLSRHDRSTLATAARLTLLVGFFFGFFYTVHPLVPFIALAILWRRRRAALEADVGAEPRPLAESTA